MDFIGAHAKPQFEQELAQKLKRNVNLPDGEASEEDEELVEQCIEVIRQTNRASVSVLQRRLRIGYTRAAQNYGSTRGTRCRRSKQGRGAARDPDGPG